jgi:hypothetical protein
MLIAQAIGAGYGADDFATLVLEQARRSGTPSCRRTFQSTTGSPPRKPEKEAWESPGRREEALDVGGW